MTKQTGGSDGGLVGGAQNISRKITVEVLDEQPNEKNLGSPQYVQQKQMIEAVAEKENESELSEQVKLALGELKLSLEAQKIPKKERAAYIDRFLAAVGSQAEEGLIDSALMDILLGDVKKRSIETNTLKEIAEKEVLSKEPETVENEMSIEPEKKEVIEKQAVVTIEPVQKEQLPSVEDEIMEDGRLNEKLLEAVAAGERFYETYEEKIKELFTKSEFGKDKEKAKFLSGKIDLIMRKWNDFIVRYEDNAERTNALLHGFKELKKNADKLLEDVSSWDASVDIKAHEKDNRGENSFERVVDLIERTRKTKIEKILSGEKMHNGGDIREIMLTQLAIPELAEDKKNEIIKKIDEANRDIRDAQKQPRIEKTFDSNGIKKDQWVIMLETAIRKIKRMTAAEFKQQYNSRQNIIVESFKGDYAEELNRFLHAHQHDSIDSFSKKEKIRFDWVMKNVKAMNDENNPFDLVIISGNTHKVRKNISTEKTQEVVKDPTENIIPKIEDLESPAVVAESAVEEEKVSMALYESAKEESFGVLSLELFQQWMDGCRKVAVQNGLKEDDVKKQMKIEIEKAFERNTKKEGKELEKVVQYILEKLK